jgi:hypothetical protein
VVDMGDDGYVAEILPCGHTTRVAALKDSSAKADCYCVNTGRQFGRPVR